MQVSDDNKVVELRGSNLGPGFTVWFDDSPIHTEVKYAGHAHPEQVSGNISAMSSARWFCDTTLKCGSMLNETRKKFPYMKRTAHKPRSSAHLVCHLYKEVRDSATNEIYRFQRPMEGHAIRLSLSRDSDGVVFIMEGYQMIK